MNQQQACTPNLTDEKSVVQHIRDLLNLAPLLARGVDEELNLFIKKLSQIGWAPFRITQFLSYASQGTRYEREEDGFGNKVVPMVIPERGDQNEWRRNLKPRAEK